MSSHTPRYTGNCICGEGGVEGNDTWARLSYVGDVTLMRQAGFDGMKNDNCAGKSGEGFEARLHQINVTAGGPILIEISNQAHGIGPPRGQPFDPHGWCGANFFRVDGDIGPDFNGITGRLRDLLQFSNFPPISRPGCWAYPVSAMCF